MARLNFVQASLAWLFLTIIGGFLISLFGGFGDRDVAYLIGFFFGGIAMWATP